MLGELHSEAGLIRPLLASGSGSLHSEREEQAKDRSTRASGLKAKGREGAFMSCWGHLVGFS